MKKGQKEYNKPRKPLYYNEYIYDDEEDKDINNSNSNCLFLISSGIFIFLFSITDIIYSYLTLDKCQTLQKSYITLNNWLFINGIIGLCYYFLMIIFYYTFYFSDEKQKGYHLLVNQSSKKSEKCETLYKSLSIFFTIFMLSFFSVGCFIYFSFFNHYCESYFVIIYMWIRLLSGLITSFSIILLIVL